MVVDELSEPTGTGTRGTVCREVKWFVITGSSSTRQSDQTRASARSVVVEVPPLPIQAEEAAHEAMIAHLARETHCTYHRDIGSEPSLSQWYGLPPGGQVWLDFRPR